MPCSETPSLMEQKDNTPFMGNRGKRLSVGADSLKLPSFGHDAIGGDALSKLLEQKLKELSYAVENSRQDHRKTGSTSLSESTSLSLTPALSPAFTAPQHNAEDCYAVFTGKMENPCFPQFSSIDRSPLDWKHNLQATEKLDHRQPSPVSILEPAFSTGSCNSSESTDSSNIDGSKACSSVQAQEVLGSSSMNKFRSIEADTDLSDSASSTSSAALAEKDANMATKSRNRELQYLRQILCNLETAFHDFAVGKSDKVTDPRLFDQLESHIARIGIEGNDGRIARKLLFDCVSECIDVRCKQYVGGGFRTWTKGSAMAKQKERLAEEVYREILGWRGMGDCMVDDLVDKDMSCRFGSWLNFEKDGFAVGEEIQSQILDSLVEELMLDFF
ncbi:PREDICTED: uncharacterized protein LOC104802701 isoform X2 [Tarenaya hassleriana]|uniref:uncharacterized protein LOC104802701 isoform X2 n=1 Tax=Tarenaya hassleriana TaxID=28532 RepID=UPI00053C4CEC|nr:PREDICTED: uncharacterized protein LOC104802701 isoform X2 [Tarenaya hassleriana]